MAGKVDVLAVMDLAREAAYAAARYAPNPDAAGAHDEDARRIYAARAAIAELIAAATEVRDAAWGPGKTDQPHILRLDAALSNMEAR